MPKFANEGRSWKPGETSILVRNREKGRSYSSIASMKTFKGKRSIKALRRRYERVVLGHTG